MTQRITKLMLKARVDYLNQITGNPLEPYVRNEDGKLVAQVGNYHLDGAYGGYSIEQMVNESGGVTTLFSLGNVSKRELFDKLCAYIDGYNACKRGE